MADFHYKTEIELELLTKEELEEEFRKANAERRKYDSYISDKPKRAELKPGKPPYFLTPEDIEKDEEITKVETYRDQIKNLIWPKR